MTGSRFFDRHHIPAKPGVSKSFNQGRKVYFVDFFPSRKNTTNGSRPDVNGALISQDFNLIGNPSGATVSGSTGHNILNADPLLRPLQNNGGPAFTRALLTGSPAIDAGSSSGLQPVDQRGERRPHDYAAVSNAVDGTDMGAFELRPAGFPTVAVTAPASQAAESGPVTQSFIVSRQGDTSASLVVNFTSSGTASASDYAFFGTAITIRAGSASAPLVITPATDDLAEGPETVIISLQPSAAYDVGVASQGSLLIADQPFDDWRWRTFGSNANAAGISGALADPDLDGTANFIEYALGTNPLNAASIPGPVLALSGGQLYLTYSQLRSTGAAGTGQQGIDWTLRGVRYRPQLSADLGLNSWSEGAATFQVDSIVPFSSELESVKLRIIGIHANDPRLFARLQLESVSE